MITVVVISGIRLYREGLAELLCRTEGLRVVGTAADPASGMRCIMERNPTIALLDMAMPDSSGTLQSIGNADTEVKVVGIAVAQSESAIRECSKAGVVGYTFREDSLHDLVLVLRRVARDQEIYQSRTVSSAMHRLAPTAPQLRHHVGGWLTDRENQIVELIGMGMTNKEIARRLSIQLPTVKNHVHNILEKLQLERRGQAAALFNGRNSHITS